LRSLALRPGDSLSFLTMTFVDGLRVISFPPPCHPSYEALAFTSAGLSPAEHVSIRWTHMYLFKFAALATNHYSRRSSDVKTLFGSGA
jgi:hypothetical protein